MSLRREEVQWENLLPPLCELLIVLILDFSCSGEIRSIRIFISRIAMTSMVEPEKIKHIANTQQSVVQQNKIPETVGEQLRVAQRDGPAVRVTQERRDVGQGKMFAENLQVRG